MSAPIRPHDADTLEYLKAAGIQGELLDRVRRLAQEAADLKAEVLRNEAIDALREKLEKAS